MRPPPDRGDNTAKWAGGPSAESNTMLLVVSEGEKHFPRRCQSEQVIAHKDNDQGKGKSKGKDKDKDKENE